MWNSIRLGGYGGYCNLYCFMGFVTSVGLIGFISSISFIVFVAPELYL